MSNDELLSILSSGDAEEVRRALDGRGPNVVMEGRPALLWASTAGNADAVLALIAMGADPNARNENGETALLSASYLGNSTVVRELLGAGAAPNAADVDGQTALMAAAKGGSIEVVRELLEAGARLDQSDSRGRTALHWAMADGDNAEVVGYLLAQGASKQCITSDGMSPHDYARALGRSRCMALL